MKSNKALWEICMNIYRRMYKEAEPPKDFDKIIKSRECKKEEFFMRHYLDEKRQEEIIEEECSKAKLSKYERHKVSKEVYLGCSPTSSREGWKKAKHKR